MIGIIPATGGNIASFIAYDQAKRFSKEPETFGKGNPDGVIASEAANNSVCGGALIPLLTLGIPDRYIMQGAPDFLMHELGLDAEGIAAAIEEKLEAL